jgi:cytochrome c oxidase assembly protein subunit 15
MHGSPNGGPWLHRYARLLAGCTFLLIVAGGLVTSTGSGLAVPDWPLSFGQLFPRMEGGVLYEHGHRLVAATIGLLTIGLVILAVRLEPRRWVRRLTWIALAAVILQGLLGGTTVLLRLPDAISVAHAGLAQLFFALTVVIAVVTSPRWTSVEPATDDEASGTRMLAVAAATSIYLQILFGAIVRHIGAGLAIPDWPLSFGRLVPAFDTRLVAWHYLHRWFALVPFTLILWTAARLVRRHRDDPWLTRPALALALLVVLQVLLGALTIWKQKAVTPTTAHVATGALVFVTSVLVAVRAHRALRGLATAGVLPHANANARMTETGGG